MATQSMTMFSVNDDAGGLAASVTVVFDDATLVISRIDYTVNSGTLQLTLHDLTTQTDTVFTKTSSGSQLIPQSFAGRWYTFTTNAKGQRVVVPNGTLEYNFQWTP